MSDIVEHKATPRAELERQIMDPNIPKNEREWWAAAEIERLRANDKARVTVHEAEIRRLSIAMGVQADDNARLQAEIKRGRMFRVKLWDALRELADLVKDEA
jgi:hypothetical protein